MNNLFAHYVSLVSQCLLPLLAALLLTACSERPNQPRLSGIWIGNGREALRLGDMTDTSARHELVNAQGFTLSVSLRADSNLLRFRSPYSILRKYGPADSLKQYVLRIGQQTDSSLTLIPVSDEAQAFFKGRRRLLFRKQAFAIDTTIHVQKIVFHTTECFGTCSVFHVEIDSTKRIRQHTEILYRSSRRDTTREGYFTGRIPDSTYHQLVTAIQTSNLRQVQSDEILCCDAPVITIILYANGQRKPFRVMSIPIVAQNLVNVLYQLAGKQLGTRTLTPFTLEGWSGKPSTDASNRVTH